MEKDPFEKQERNAADEKKSVNEDGKENKESVELDEAQKRKIVCCLAYVFGILFFLPLILYPKDDFAKFHANQSLVILLTSIIVSALCSILGMIPAIGFIFGIIGGVLGVAILIACILGIVAVVQEEKTKLPLIGNIRIIS